jgi:predicted membrane-bound spermidine synthase
LASENNFPRYKVIPLLFLSGFCALVYQVAWLRELRLVFGVSTMAISAVLAIFMGGIGIGSYFLGSYAEKHKEPLKLYGYLEIGIAVAAFLSPFLISLVRLLYIAMGGSQTMGLPLATFVRLVMSAMILGVPTFLMGGTLPAVARAVETDADVDRSDIGLLYGINTLGAVSGVLFAYFFMLEHLGTLTTTWLASLLNGMVGLLALNLARNFYSEKPAVEQKVVKDKPAADTASSTYNRNLILAAGAVVGFVFLLMEIVWYRMMSPLLGGTTYTFGLVLAVALLGMGIGGWLYSLRRLNAPVTLVGFATTCGLEAFCLAVPFALGDRIAIWSVQLIPFDAIVGFYNYVVAWLQTTVIVVLPAAIVAGYQFPLLVALMGRGRQNVARHTGYIYASNTTGSIIGSLAGGFGLLPLLTATGCWQLAIWLLLLLALVAMFYSIRVESFSRIYHVLSPVIIIGSHFQRSSRLDGQFTKRGTCVA